MSEPTAQSLSKLMAELAALPDRLAALLSGRDEAKLRLRPAAGAWSVKEQACHLRDSSRINHERLFLLATHDQPELAVYDEAQLAVDKDYQHSDTAAIIPELRSWREETLYLLADLSPESWGRTGQMAGEEFTIERLMRELLEHDREHLAAIAGLLAAA